MKTTLRTLARTAPAAGVLAAAVVVSGASGAVATKLITGKQIKDGTVTTADIRNGSLTGIDVHDGSLGTADTSPDLDRFEQRIGGFTVVGKNTVPVGSGGQASVSATCPAGTSLLGAFAWWGDQVTGPQIEYHAPADAPQYAFAYSENKNSQDDTMYLTVTCGNTTS